MSNFPIQNLPGAIFSANLDLFLMSAGAAFEASYWAEDVPAGQRVYVRAKVGPAKAIVLRDRYATTSGSQASYAAYLAGDVTAGTPGASIPVIKQRGDSSIEPESTLTEESGVVLGAAVPRAVVPLFGVDGGSFRGAANNTETALRVYSPGAEFIIALHNRESNQSRDIFFSLQWWELSPQALPGVQEV